MPKVMWDQGQPRRVLMPSSTCGACKGTGQFRRADGRKAECTNCYGYGRFAFTHTAS